MQIGNNRPDGPRPNNRKQTHLDPDLTKANRDGIEDTTKVARQKTRESIESRSPAKVAESRKAGQDSFVRSKPEQDPGFDVGERIKNARNQAKQNRIGNARDQRTENQADRPDKSERIASARAQKAEAQSQRIQNSRRQAKASAPDNDGRVKPNETRPSREADKSERTGNAREQHGERMQRVDNARVQHTEASKAKRIANARSQYKSNHKPGDTRLARTTPDLPGVGSKMESAGARAVRVTDLKQAHAAGELNTPERASVSAGRLLGGE